METRFSPLLLALPLWAGCAAEPGANPNDLSVSVDDLRAPEDAGCAAAGEPTAASVCSAGKWCWSLPLPQGNDLRAIAGASPNDIWAVGAFGTALHFDGTAWSGIPTPSAMASLWGVTAVAAAGGKAWLFGSGLAQWDGTAFSPQALPGGAQGGEVFQSAWASGPSDVWAVSTSTTIHFDGTAWSQVDAGGGVDVNGSGPGDVWIAGGDFAGGHLRHFDGHAWSFAGPSDLFATSVLSFGRSDVWAFGTRRDAALSDGGPGGPVQLRRYDGTTWSDAPPGWLSIDRYARLVGSSSGDVWLIGGDDPTPHWDGTRWSGVSLGVKYPVAWLAGRSDLWAVGAAGAMAHWTGAPVCKRSARDVARVVWSTGPNDVWALTGIGVTGGGPVLHYDGHEWKPQGNQDSRLLRTIWGSGPNDVWAAGDAMTMVHWNGTAWSSYDLSGLDFGTRDWDAGFMEPFPGNYSLDTVWGRAADDVWAVGSSSPFPADSVILHFDGTRWSPGARPMPQTTLGGVWASSATDVWVVGVELTSDVHDPWRGLLLHWDGTAWSKAAGGGNHGLASVWGSGPSDVWATGISGDDTVLHFDGQAWSPRSIGITPFFVGPIWGRGPNDVWIAGQKDATAGLVLHFDGMKWSQSALGAGVVTSLSGTSATDVWIAGPGLLHRGP